MSTSVDQRAKGEGQQLSLVAAKDSEFAYMPTQPAQAGYPAGTSSMADPYSFMSNYYPYYAMPEEMGATGVWSTGDMSSSAAMTYGYSPLGADYGSMMADYGYGIGWYPGADGTAWGTAAGVPATVKDEQGNAYAATAGGYYTMEAMPVYGSATGAPPQQENVQRDLDVGNIEQGMQGMNINGGRHGAGEYNKDTGAMTAASSASGAPKSWATVAGQQSYSVKPRGGVPSSFPRAPLQSAKMHDGAWESRAAGEPGRPAHDGWSASRRRPNPTMASNAPLSRSAEAGGSSGLSPTLSQPGQYNPKEFDLNPKAARFFIIKSYAEDDIHRSIKYGIWCSTEYGNKRLDAAFREREGKGPIFLFYSVNGSGHFCGVAQMMSPVDYQSSAGVWAQDKWKGKFEVKWVYVKDVPNSQLRHIRLENNEGKPVTNSRDTQEVPPEKGCQVLRVIHQYRHTTSIFDDFSHYEKRQEEDAVKK